MSALTFGCSERGRQTAIYKGFEYWHERDMKNGTTSWRCCQHKKLSCRARIVTVGEQVVGERQIEHTHGGNVAKSLARKAVAAMKTKVENIEATPSAAHAAVVSTLSDDVVMALPKKATVYRILQSHRSKVNQTGENKNALARPPFDLMFEMPEKFLSSILFDSGPGSDRLIIMGCEELLDALAAAEVWLADGTFKVVPTIFFHLFSVHFEQSPYSNPVGLYCLLTNKTADTFKRVVAVIKTLIPSANPKTILIDFEKTAMDAFRSAYPSAFVTGCYYHLCQSVIRRVGELGMKQLYENDEDFRKYVRCLPALAYVKLEDTAAAFDFLADNKPAELDEGGALDNLLTFFESTYVRGRKIPGAIDQYGPPMYPIVSWNKHQSPTAGIARTTFIVEGWHHSLQSLYLCHHPTMWTFLTGLQQDIEKHKQAILSDASDKHKAARVRYQVLDERLKNIINGYEDTKIMVYLKSIAHLSYS